MYLLLIYWTVRNYIPDDHNTKSQAIKVSISQLWNSSFTGYILYRQKNIQQICLLEISAEWNKVHTPWSVKAKWMWEVYTRRKLTEVGTVFVNTDFTHSERHDLSVQTSEASFSDSVNSYVDHPICQNLTGWAINKYSSFKKEKSKSNTDINIDGV